MEFAKAVSDFSGFARSVCRQYDFNRSRAGVSIAGLVPSRAQLSALKIQARRKLRSNRRVTRNAGEGGMQNWRGGTMIALQHNPL